MIKWKNWETLMEDLIDLAVEIIQIRTRRLTSFLQQINLFPMLIQIVIIQILNRLTKEVSFSNMKQKKVIIIIQMNYLLERIHEQLSFSCSQCCWSFHSCEGFTFLLNVRETRCSSCIVQWSKDLLRWNSRYAKLNTTTFFLFVQNDL